MVKPTTCPWDLCPSWLVKAGLGEVWDTLGRIINPFLSLDPFPVALKEAIVRPLFKKSILNPAVTVIEPSSITAESLTCPF